MYQRWKIISPFFGPVELSPSDLLRIQKWYNLALNKKSLDSADEDTITKIRAVYLSAIEHEEDSHKRGSKFGCI